MNGYQSAGSCERYGDLLALDHLSLNVEEGEVLGLLGPNGSGKTTAINCMLSLLEYDKGSVEIFGKPMAPDAYDIKKDIGVVMQNVAVFDELTVLENIDYFCGLYVRDREKRKQLVKEAVSFVGLDDFRRLNIACGIAHKPKLIFFDEPTVAVDPQSRNNILEGIQRLNREGATIVYTSHYMEEIEQICSRIVILDKGAVIADGTKEELKDMISLGETITVESTDIQPEYAEEMRRIPGVVSVENGNGRLVVKSEKNRNNLENVLEFLKKHSVAYGRIYTELPTLNDVFLELTGKELRD